MVIAGWIEHSITDKASCMTDQPEIDSLRPHGQIPIIRRPVPWLDAGRALFELAFARLGHARLQVPRIHYWNHRSAATGRAPTAAQPADAATIDRVAYVVPRVAYYLPWRSDCLIQAMAAQRWLDRLGIATSIVIGVDKPENGEFAAHAWLQYGDRIVTGGEVSNFKVLLETPLDPT